MSHGSLDGMESTFRTTGDEISQLLKSLRLTLGAEKRLTRCRAKRAIDVGLPDLQQRVQLLTFRGPS